MQDYKSLCVVVTICSTLANIQTDTLTHTHIHREHFDQLIWKAQPAELKIRPNQTQSNKPIPQIHATNGELSTTQQQATQRSQHTYGSQDV